MRKRHWLANNHLTILASLLLGILEMISKLMSSSTWHGFFLDRISVENTFEEISAGTFRNTNLFVLKKSGFNPWAPQRKRWHGRSLDSGALVEVSTHLRFFRTQFEVGFPFGSWGYNFWPEDLHPFGIPPSNANYERNPFLLPVGKGLYRGCVPVSVCWK